MTEGEFRDIVFDLAIGKGMDVKNFDLELAIENMFDYIHSMEDKIKELEEYKFMYDELCK